MVYFFSRAQENYNYPEPVPQVSDQPRYVQVADANLWLKKGVWAYFFLLIFEGALRKWILPDFATPLLIIRDPLAIWLLFKCWQRGLLPNTPYLSLMFTIGIVGFVTALLLGHGNILVATYGARIFLIHFPFIFVIGCIMNREDVIKMGICTLWIAIPMVILMGLQFYSPQSAWVNRGVGGDLEGAGFGGALGFFRPPGTFSFTNGNTLFFSFAACFIFYFLLNSKSINKWVLFGALGALFFAIPFSISRALLFQVIISLLFMILAISSNSAYLGRLLMVGIIASVAFLFLAQTDLFQTGMVVFTSRFESANETEGGLEGVFLDRFLGGMIEALANSPYQPVFGKGLGIGSNVGSLVVVGEQAFLVGEGEWGRIIGELGPLLGLPVILLRIGLTLTLGFASLQRLLNGDLLPWMLFSFGLLIISQGQSAQPTALGFYALMGGLMIASFKSPAPVKRGL